MVTPQSVQGHTGLTHHFLIFDIRTLWRSVLSARAPECQKLKNGGLDQYGLERFGRLVLLQSEKCGTERVNLQIITMGGGIRLKLSFIYKKQKSLFEPPFRGLRDNVCTLSIARRKARGQLPICRD